MKARFLLLLTTTTLIINLIIYSIHSKIIQISNSKPRRDVNNNIINAHSGNIVFVDSTYFLYGENYGNGSNYIVPNNTKIPKLVVYTSPDMLTWTFKGFLHNNSIDQTKWWQHSGKWPHFPNGTWWSPSHTQCAFLSSPGECGGMLEFLAPGGGASMGEGVREGVEL